MGALILFVAIAAGVLAWVIHHSRKPFPQPDIIYSEPAGRRQAEPKEGLPGRFVVFDLETTGLDPLHHEIIEIGAIRVNRDSDTHDTFRVLVLPKGRISARITELTGLDRKILKKDGIDIEVALVKFREFVGDLPMVAYNAVFDQDFLLNECVRSAQSPFLNTTYCALRAARKAWPGRDSYRLSSLAKDGGLDVSDSHTALGDCQRTLIIYATAVKITGKLDH